MLWILLLVLADPSFSLRTEPDGTLQIGRGNCISAEDEIDMSLDWDDIPLEFAVGTKIKLCCSPNIPDPLDDTNVSVEWFYTTTDNFGQFEDRVKNSSTKSITNHYNKYDKYDKSLLTINQLAMSDNGVFACLVNTTTLDAKIAVSMFLKWYKISVYNPNLTFKDQKYTKDIEVPSHLTLSYALESYQCMCEEDGVNEGCDLVVDTSVNKPGSKIQVINNLDNEELIVWFTEYEDQVITLTASLYCPSNEANGLTRTWAITDTIHDRKPMTLYRKMSETRLTLDGPSTAYCIGTCGQFTWSVLLGKESENSYQTLTDDAKLGDVQTKRFSQNSIKYSFNEVDLLLGTGSTKRKFMKLSYTVSVDSTRTDTAGFDIALKCGCDGGSLKGFDETASVTGTPTQRMDPGNNNCLGRDHHIPVSSDAFAIRRSPCCNIQTYLQDSVITTTLFKNGVKVDGGDEKHYYIPTLTSAADTSSWYEANSGFYQCFVSGYQDHNGQLKMWSNIIDFQERIVEEVKVLALNSTAPKLTVDCPAYAADECAHVYSKIRTMYNNTQPLERKDHDILVLNGSCVQVTVQIKSHPKAEVNWRLDPENFFDTFEDSRCDGDLDQRGGRAGVLDEYSFKPYDLVTTTSTWFIKVTASFETTASSGGKNHAFNFSVISEPVLEPINCTESGLTVKCTVRGFPKPELVFYSISSDELVSEVMKCRDDLNIIEDEIEGTVVSVCREVYTVNNAKGFNIFATNGYSVNETVQEVKADKTADPSGDLILPLVILCLVLIVVVFIVIICCVWKRWKKRRGGKEYIPLKEIDKMCYDYRTLNEAELVGQGNFGEVWRGWSDSLEPEGYKGKRTDIVIKKVKMIGAYDGLIDDLWREKDMLMKVRGHQNVSLIFGYSKGPPAIVIEYCPLGSLDKLLKESRKFKTTEGNDGYAVPDEMLPIQRLTFKSTEILDFGRQIAFGMDWIGSKGIIHRDLAARNVVVAQEHNSYIMKIIDFGLARLVDEEGLYIRREGRQIPVKWIAPESFNDEYTIMSDVWSFGVTLWEIVTLGAEPYHNIPNRELMPRLKHGYRLPKPAICEENLYRLMENCWQLSPDNRPKFSAIVSELEASLEDSGNYLAPDIYTNNLDITHFMDVATLDAATAAAGLNLNNFNCNDNNDNNNCDNTPKSPPMKNVYSPEPLAENVTITPNSNLNVNNHNLRKQALSNNSNTLDSESEDDDLDPLVMPLV